MAKTFKQFYLNTDVKKATIQVKAADERNQERRAAKHFKDDSDEIAIVEAEDVPLDEETYQKYLKK